MYNLTYIVAVLGYRNELFNWEHFCIIIKSHNCTWWQTLEPSWSKCKSSSVLVDLLKIGLCLSIQFQLCYGMHFNIQDWCTISSKVWTTYLTHVPLRMSKYKLLLVCRHSPMFSKTQSTPRVLSKRCCYSGIVAYRSGSKCSPTKDTKQACMGTCWMS